MRKYLFGTLAFVLAFGVFSVSVLRCSSVSKVYATSLSTPKPKVIKELPQVDYQMAYIGKILPDNPLWSVKVIRDWIWYYVTVNPLKKAELALLFSDKRILASKLLLESKKPDIAISTFTKGEKYLEIAANQEVEARKKGIDTSDFVFKLANSSLKHRQIIEQDILPIAPEDARPEIIKIEYISKNIYKMAKENLDSLGKTSPKSPFDGE